MVLGGGRERMVSAVAKRFILQEKNLFAELLCPCGVQRGKGSEKVDADAASLLFWMAGDR